MNKAAKDIVMVTVVVKSILGFSMGVYEATCGAYFYERFGAALNPANAILLAMVLLAVRQGLITVLEMPTGALADTIGRVQVVVLSWIVRAAFFVCLAAMWFCQSVIAAVMCGAVASILWAICYTSFNGAFSAWCVDALKERAPERSYASLVSYAHNYYTVMAAIGTPIGIMFYLHGWASLIYAITAGACFLCMAYCLLQMKETASIAFVDRHRVRLPVVLRGMKDRFTSSYGACVQRPVLFWIVLTFGSFMFLLNMVKFLWPIFLKETTGARQFSMQWICLAVTCDLACAVSSRLFFVMNNKFRSGDTTADRLQFISRVFAGSAMVSALMVIGHGYATAHHWNDFPYLIVTVLAVVVSYGFLGTCFEILINYYIGHENQTERATIVSAGSFIRGVLFIFLAVPSAGSHAAESPIYWAIPAGILLMSALFSLCKVEQMQRKSTIVSTVA